MSLSKLASKLDLDSIMKPEVLFSLLAASALGAAIYWFFKTPPMPKELKSIKTVSTLPLIWKAMRGEGTDAQYNLFRDVLEEFGVIKMWMFGRWIIMFGEPESIKFIATHTDIFPKFLPPEERPGTLIDRFFGVNVVFSNDDVWRRHRKITNPALHSIYVQPFNDCANELVNHITATSHKGPIGIHSLMMRVTLDVLGKAAFAFDFKAVQNPHGEFVAAYESLMVDANKMFYLLFPSLEPYIRPRSTWRRLKKVERLVLDLIEKKRREGVGEKDTDLLARMLKANMEEGLTNKELRDNMFVFILAGHDTTASSLSFLLYHLAIDKSLQTRARTEVFQDLGDSYTNISIEDQKKLGFLTACIKENLRLHPSVPILGQRICRQDVDVGKGLVVPKGNSVAAHIYGLQQHRQYWSNPERFDPNRFLRKGEVVEGTWMPFGSGSRACQGMNFSLIEQRIIMSHLLRAFEWELAPGSIHEGGIKYAGGGLGFLSPKEIDIVFRQRE